MKKNYLFTTLVVFGLCFSCDQQKEEPTIAQDQKEVISRKDVSQMDRLSNTFAKTLATSMGNVDLRNVIKSEVVKQFDGDYNVLLAQIIDQPVETNEAGDGRVSELSTFRELLVQTQSDARTTFDLNATLDSLLEIYPTLQISVPGLEVGTADTWDTQSQIPQVVIMDTNFDDQNAETLNAYDEYGNVTSLDAKTEPSELVIVVRPSESVVALERLTDTGGRVAQVEPCGDPVLQTDLYDYYATEDIYGCDTGGGSGGGGTGGGSSIPCYRSQSNNQTDYINKARFLSKNKIRELEPWVYGKPEMYVIIVNVNVFDGFPTYQTRHIYAGENGWYSADLVGGINYLKVKNLDINTGFVFDKALHGYQTYYYWMEEDFSLNREDKLFQITSMFDSEDWPTSDHISGYAFRNLYTGDDNAGLAIVDYTDRVCDEGVKYTTGTNYLYFYINHQ
ncbi:MAG: hypothetical protein ABJ004_20685 [Cyclobacteriaceae bacterium]